MAYLLSLCMKFSRYMVKNLYDFSAVYSLVELRGFEPLTPCLQGRCSPN